MKVFYFIYIFLCFIILDSCSMFMEPVRDYFEQYTQTVSITDVKFMDNTIRDKNGTICISSDIGEDESFRIVYLIVKKKQDDFDNSQSSCFCNYHTFFRGLH